MMRCSETTSRGEPCNAPPELVDQETGFCRSHGPGASNLLSAQGRKGAETTARKLQGDGLDPDELPPLDSHANAKIWLEIIGRAVTSRRLIHNEARVAIQAVSEWVKTEGERATAEVLTELRSEVERLKKQMAVQKVQGLRAVK